MTAAPPTRRIGPLTAGEFTLYCHRLGLGDATKGVIAQVRASGPSRLVEEGGNNVPSVYPSRKMGRTIQAESHTVELAVVFLMEHGPAFLEFYDQPPPIKLTYPDANGRARGHWHTPDFFVLEEKWTGWEEVKEERELESLGAKSPNRYLKDAAGTWRCPPGEEYARHFGLGYRVRLAESISPTLRRNMVFLADYHRADRPLVRKEAAEAIQRCVGLQPGISLADLHERLEDAGANRDDVNAMIAQGRVYADLEAAPLVEPRRVRVFRDAETARSFGLVAQTSPSSRPDWAVSKPLVARPGQSLLYDGRALTIVTVGQRKICLRSEEGDLTEMTLVDFESLSRKGQLAATAPDGEDGLRRRAENMEKAQEAVAHASPQDLERANQRYGAIQPYLDRDLPDDIDLPRGSPGLRSLRRWRANYRAAERELGCGYMGLLPSKQKPGNYGEKMPTAVRKAMNQAIEQDFETIKNKKAGIVYDALRSRCAELGIDAPSRTTFYQAIQRRPKHEQTLKRQGRRAAYRHEPFRPHLADDVPRHGDRPFEIAHIDHTELDVELVCSRTGKNLGRPWLTLMIDAYSRRILALHLTFDPPSYRSCMMVLRVCVRRHGRLPQTLVVDGGKEFRGTYFEMLLGVYEVTRKTRPGAKPRFGSVVERIFGVTNTLFIHNLAGNTQLTKNVRQLTKAVDPKRHAVWTLESLHAILSEFAYEVYDARDHRTLGQSPREAFAQGMALGGARSHRLIAYDDAFHVLTLPTTPKGTARVIPRHGVKINYFYYSATEMIDPLVENQEVPVRFDPFDLGTAYAFLKGRAGTGRWVRCQSMHWGLLQGRTERELQVAADEMRQRNRLHTRKQAITAKPLVEILGRAEAQEKLGIQRLRDLAAKDLIASAGRRGSPPGADTPVTEASPSAPAAVTATPPRAGTWGQRASEQELDVY